MPRMDNLHRQTLEPYPVTVTMAMERTSTVTGIDLIMMMATMTTVLAEVVDQVRVVEMARAAAKGEVIGVARTVV